MSSAVGRAYATAFFESNQEKGLSAADMDRAEAELKQLIELIETSSDLILVLWGGIGSDQEKLGVINEIGAKLGLSVPVMNLLRLLSDKRRLASLSEVTDMLKVVRLEAGGGLMGEVIAADALSREDVADLESSFSKKLGKKVSFQTKVDPALIAGVRVTVGGVTYDGSLLAQLKRARASLVMGSSSTQSV